jgi:citrate/tricarballylate utilization protein
MQPTEHEREGARILAICNACRYCEQYCPAFQALEQRSTFATADLSYLANLCHGCGECLYACQYAPPHEFSINVPQTLAAVRVDSYERYAWPPALSGVFRRGVGSALLLAVALAAVLLGATLATNADALRGGAGADFYAVIPHGVLVTLFGGVGAFVLLALAIGVARCRRDFAATATPAPSHERRPGLAKALHDAFTLRHLHVAGADCVSALEVRTPWRRVFHQLTAYGFLLCFASTCIAALYHFAGSPAPYAYTSLPVLLGTAGGIGLVSGTLGLSGLRRTRDRALSHADQERLDRAFVALLLGTAATGLLLLAWRQHAGMPLLLILHLGFVLALFVTLPYGKFVHGLYRLAALAKYWREKD